MKDILERIKIISSPKAPKSKNFSGQKNTSIEGRGDYSPELGT